MKRTNNKLNKIKDIEKKKNITFITTDGKTHTIGNLNPLIKLRPIIAYSVDYALTITLKPMMYVHVAQKQYESLVPEILNIFRECKLILVPELTKQFNVHFHGIINVPLCDGRDPSKWIHDKVRTHRKIGMICVKQMTDYEGWYTYCMKDRLLNTSLEVIEIIQN